MKYLFEQELEIARELWKAHVFAHHLSDTQTEVRIMDEWAEQCELVLLEEVGMRAFIAAHGEPLIEGYDAGHGEAWRGVARRGQA